MSQIYHIEVNRETGRVHSIHLGDSALLEYRQSVTDRRVIPLIDAKLAQEMRTCPEHYAVRDNRIVLLPEEERHCHQLHLIDQLQKRDSPLDYIAKHQGELNNLIADQTETIAEAIRINNRVAVAAEELAPEVNQLKSTLEEAAKQFAESTKVLAESTRVNSDAVKAITEQNTAIMEELRGLRKDMQAFIVSLRER